MRHSVSYLLEALLPLLFAVCHASRISCPVSRAVPHFTSLFFSLWMPQDNLHADSAGTCSIVLSPPLILRITFPCLLPSVPASISLDGTLAKLPRHRREREQTLRGTDMRTTRRTPDRIGHFTSDSCVTNVCVRLRVEFARGFRRTMLLRRRAAQ